MTVWRRSRAVRICGMCGHTIPAGAAFLELTIATLDHVKIRCETCDGPAPLDLAPLPPPDVTPTPERAPFQPLRGVALDFKQRQMGREPGEDDE